MKKILHSPEEMKDFTREFLLELKLVENTATVLGLSGELGAGKTAFTQALARELGITETVVSPTFVIMKMYQLSGQKWQKLIHIDAYRLEKSTELEHLGWQEMIADPANLIVVEWPERVADIIPLHTHIIFTHISENERGVEVVS